MSAFKNPDDDLRVTPTLGSIKFEHLIHETPATDIAMLTDLVFLDSFTAEEATKISEHPDAAKRLDELTTQKLVTVIAESQRLFQINSLVRDEFRTLLAKRPERFREVAFRSANAVKEKDPLRALELFGLAQNLEAAASLAISNLQYLIHRGDLELLSKWAPVISKAAGGGNKGTKLLKAFGLYATGKYDQLKAALRELETGLQSGAESEVVSYESALLRVRLNFAYGKFDEVFAGTSALGPAPEPDRHRITNVAYSATSKALSASFYLQDPDRFFNYYDQIAPNFKDSDSNLSDIAINNFKAMAAFLTGQYLDAHEYALAACTIAESIGVTGSYFPYESAFVLMDTSLEFGEDEKSQGFIQKYLALAIKTNQYPWIAAFHTKAALVKLQNGDLDAALKLIEKGRTFVTGSLFGPDIAFLLDGHELLVRLALGEMERVERLLQRLPETRQIKILKIVLEISQNPENFTRLSSAIPEDTAREKFHKELLLANVMAAVSPDAAKAHLLRAIDIAEPNGYFRAFLNLSPQVKSYVLELSEEHSSIYIENLAGAIRNQSKMMASSIALEQSPLTRREIEILRKLETGNPILEIAASLNISKNTIKTHLKNLYRKLEVEGRDEAVTRGREMALL